MEFRIIYREGKMWLWTNEETALELQKKGLLEELLLEAAISPNYLVKPISGFDLTHEL